MRRSLLPAILAAVLVPLTVAGVLRLIPEPPSSVLAFPRPTHRVAVAVEGAMQAVLASAVRGNSTFYSDLSSFRRPDGRLPVPGEVELPEDYPAFWHQLAGPGPAPTSPRAARPSPTLTVLRDMDFTGKARDGREVKVTVRSDPFGKGTVVDFHGDAEAARVLAGPIADRLAHPAHEHESPEDRAALTAFFAPKKPAAPVAPPLDPAVEKAGGVDPAGDPR